MHMNARLFTRKKEQTELSVANDCRGNLSTLPEAVFEYGLANKQIKQPAKCGSV